ncbi:McrC family protein [Acidovorax sp. sif1233]|nr:McrC family protein [Acidovorax sp. sif1233]
MDLTNQVGFHRLSVQVAGATHTFDFRTSTAKATWEEVRSMAEVCANSYFGYRRQFAYMAANGTIRKVRLPQIHYAWLRDRLPEIERLVRSINHRPAVSHVRTVEVSLRSQGLSVAQTSRLLREKHHLLERAEGGPIQVGGVSYWPSRVAVHTRERQTQLDEHVQIAAFLQVLAAQCLDLATVVASPVRTEVQGFAELLKVLRALPVFRGLLVRPDAKPATVLPTTMQRSDKRYGRMRDLHAEYGADIADSTDFARSIRANVKDVWEVYQTFVAHVVGNALGLDYSSPDRDLRKRSAQGWSMRSEEWRLFFDTKPPKHVLSSWRDAAGRPADERPDILLVHPATGRVIVLDAKFKLDAQATRATQPDLFEMQGYLNSFAAKSGGIIFPGPTLAASRIAAKGNSLLELPIRADHFAEAGGATSVHEYVREAIKSLSI